MMKKDYEKFAEAIKVSRAEANNISKECGLGVECLVVKIILILQLNNPNFDYLKFKKACGDE